MKRLLLLALVLTAGTAHAQVDPKVAEQCKDARDFLGCVKAFTTPVAPADDGLQALRNAMKIAAGRIYAGMSLNNSLELFRPVTDELSLVESQYPNSLAVRKAKLAHELFSVIRLSWDNRIDQEIKYREFNQLGYPYVYDCKILKMQADLFDSKYPGSAINWSYKKGVFGWNACKVNRGEHPLDYMWPKFLRVLREGSTSPAEIKAKKAAAKEKAKKIQREQELCALGPWKKYLEENPVMKSWAKANPGPAEAAKKKFLADPENQVSCGSSSISHRLEFFKAHPVDEAKSTPNYVCNRAGSCIPRKDYLP
tara:strand:+ start:242 stop:1171 length:930 start_codon:yes stop_codon:yes gene_type:complete